MKYMKNFLLVFVLVSFVFACAKDDEMKDDELTIGMVTDVGGVNDQSFNQISWEGLLRAKDELGVDVRYLESTQAADYEVNLETFASSDVDLILGIGFLMSDIIKSEAERYPENKYSIVDSSYGDDTPSNVVGLLFKDQQSSFLVGYIAGKVTKTNKIGFVGGIKFAITERFELGYIAGAKYANPDVEVFSVFAESFTDTAKGKAVATQMYSDGADIVFHAAGGLGDGVIEAAREQGLWAIGVDKDQNSLAPDNVLTSAVKRVDNAVYEVIKDLQNGQFKGGVTQTYGLAEKGVGIAETSSKNVPADVLEEVKGIEQDLIDGTIELPYDIDQLRAIVASS